MEYANVVAGVGIAVMACGGGVSSSPAGLNHQSGNSNLQAEAIDGGATVPAEIGPAWHPNCGTEGCECKVAGWDVPDLSTAVYHGSIEKEFQGLPQIFHSYTSSKGVRFISYEIAGGPIYAWEIIGGLIDGQRDQYAVVDHDCDGIFEAKGPGCQSLPKCARP